MYKLCKTEQSALRQRQLEEALLSAMAIQRYEDISVSDMCTDIGIPRKAFYRYFDSKEDALHALIDHRLLDLRMDNSRIAASGKQRMLQELTGVFVFWLEQKPLLDALYRNGLSSVLVARVITHAISEQMLDFELHKLYPDPKALKAVVSFATCGIMTTVLQWHREGFERKPEEMAEIVYQIMSRPLIQGE